MTLRCPCTDRPQRCHLFCVLKSPALLTNSLHTHLPYPSFPQFFEPIFSCGGLYSPAHLRIPRGDTPGEQPILLLSRGPGHCWVTWRSNSGRRHWGTRPRPMHPQEGQVILVNEPEGPTEKQGPSLHLAAFVPRPSCQRASLGGMLLGEWRVMSGHPNKKPLREEREWELSFPKSRYSV